MAGILQCESLKHEDVRLARTRAIWLRFPDERAPYAGTVFLSFAGRECSAIESEGEKLLPADEQISDDAWRAAVETFVRRLLAIFRCEP